MAGKKNKKIQALADVVFEVSWEVCNKVGGINTVLASKAPQMIKYYKDGYFLVGPYFPENIKLQFEEKPPEKAMKEIFASLEKEGIKCHFGVWLIEGEPKVILIESGDLWKNINHYKWELWNEFKVDSLNSPFEVDEPIVWGKAVSLFLEKASSVCKDLKIVAHFHEWLAGTGLLFTKKESLPVKTVFTTHATTIGRSLAFNNVDIYSGLENIDADKEAYNCHIQTKHQLEKAAANFCDVFTTVSEITAVECQHFLGRLPDVLLPNGLDLSKFLSFEEIAIKHRIQRARIREFLFYYFFPHYVFDLKNTLFYFIIGRYEFHAKGIDIFIKSLSALNEKLKEEKSKKTIVSFFWIPAKTKGVDPGLLENKGLYFDIKQFVEDNSEELVESYLYALMAGKDLRNDDAFEDKTYRNLERKIKKIKREVPPLISTHILENQNDTILEAFKSAGLQNREDDRIKVIFYPTYLTETDRLLELNVQGAIQGCHLGVFPSYYEPWGYTPMETAVEGVAAVTSNLSGVGRFMNQIKSDKEHPGIFILDNFARKEEEIVNELSRILYDYAKLPRQERVENKIKARELVEYCDWNKLIRNYIAAHNEAFK